MKLRRHDFVTAATLGVSAAALAGCSHETSPPNRPKLFTAQALAPHDYDRDRILAFLRQEAPHKQVFQVEQLQIDGNGAAAVFVKMQNSMNAFDFSLDLGRLQTLAILMGNATTLALNDDLWEKYRIGTVYGFKDVGGRTIRKNDFYKARTSMSTAGGPRVPNNIYHDFSGEAVAKRGAGMMICNNSLAGVAGQLANASGTADGMSVLHDLKSGLLPGYTVVPAGVATLQIAQEHGWKVYTVLS